MAEDVISRLLADLKNLDEILKEKDSIIYDKDKEIYKLNRQLEEKEAEIAKLRSGILTSTAETKDYGAEFDRFKSPQEADETRLLSEKVARYYRRSQFSQGTVNFNALDETEKEDSNPIVTTNETITAATPMVPEQEPTEGQYITNSSSSFMSGEATTTMANMVPAESPPPPQPETKPRFDKTKVIGIKTIRETGSRLPNVSHRHKRTNISTLTKKLNSRTASNGGSVGRLRPVTENNKFTSTKPNARARSTGHESNSSTIYSRKLERDEASGIDSAEFTQQDYRKLFNMSQRDFHNLPNWRKNLLKRRAGIR